MMVMAQECMRLCQNGGVAGLAVLETIEDVLNAVAGVQRWVKGAGN